TRDAIAKPPEDEENPQPAHRAVDSARSAASDQWGCRHPGVGLARVVELARHDARNLHRNGRVARVESHIDGAADGRRITPKAPRPQAVTDHHAARRPALVIRRMEGVANE